LWLALILAQIGSTDDLVEVGEVLTDPSAADVCRLGAARALANWRDPRVGEVLKRGLQLTSDNHLVTSEIIQALAWAEIRRQAKGAAESVRPYLRALSPDIRFSAVLALGNLNAVEMVEDVAALLGDAEMTSTGSVIKDEARRVVEKLRSRSQRNQDRG